MLIITMTQTDLRKNPNTKTTYLEDKKEVSTITEEEYENITCSDTLKWFRGLGGTETTKKSYSAYGYNIYLSTSTSPDRQTKIVREFKFKYN